MSCSNSPWRGISERLRIWIFLIKRFRRPGLPRTSVHCAEKNRRDQQLKGILVPQFARRISVRAIQFREDSGYALRIGSRRMRRFWQIWWSSRFFDLSGAGFLSFFDVFFLRLGRHKSEKL